MSGTRRYGSRRPAGSVVVGDNDNGYVETDPTGRYGRFEEVLGKGAMKCVYRGFDEERGVEVAWNQASLCDVLRTPDAVQRMYSEVQLLRSLRHDAVIGLQAWWVHLPSRTFNFITELFSSGTLRCYRLRYPRVRLRAVRSWARQILRGLAYLHARRVIHRDLKCDNILVNGHLGQVKIADLGLAAVLREAGQAARSVIGTPEFMAPEMYDEEYDERVDVYSFGMCMLEMLTLEFPYAECSNPAQIYKKVTSGKLPDAFYRVKDQEAQRFIGRCLAAASHRPSAEELLHDPFLLEQDAALPSPRPLPAADVPFTCSSEDDTSCSSLSDEPARTDMTITGKLNAEEDTIFLKVQIADAQTGHVRNIYFPFDMASDTAIDVATEMVKELDITDRDPSEIAAMIEQEIVRLLPSRGEQHEYSYPTHDDDDENEEQPPPPFYYLSSSPSSSCSGGFSGPHGTGAWSKDRHGYYSLSDDDDTSSMHSGKYSALHYVSGHQQDDSSEAHQQEDEGRPGTSSKTTRFGPGESGSSGSPRRTDTAQMQSKVAHQLQHAGRPRQRDDEDERRRRKMMSRNRSMVDMRSQLLHRTLVEELNRRLFFNTVGAVENIGFRTPQGYGSSSSSSSSSTRGHRGRRSKEDDKNQRYYML